jgi:hypothetical protein
LLGYVDLRLFQIAAVQQHCLGGANLAEAVFEEFNENRKSLRGHVVDKIQAV